MFHCVRRKKVLKASDETCKRGIHALVGKCSELFHLKEQQKIRTSARDSQASYLGFQMVVYEKIYLEAYINN